MRKKFAKIKYFAKRYLTVFVVLTCLIVFNANAVFASEVSLSQAISSSDLLNTQTPFLTTGAYSYDYSGTGRINATAKYMTGSSMTGSYQFVGGSSIAIDPGSYIGCFVPFSKDVYFVVGYSYDITLSVSSQVFDADDNRFNPSAMKLLFYCAGLTHSSASISPVSVTPNSMDGYDVRFIFTFAEPYDRDDFNFYPNVGIDGAFRYTHLVLRFYSPSPVTISLSPMFYLLDWSCKRSDGDAYLSQVIVDGFAGVKDDVQQGVVDGLNQYDQAMPTHDYSAGKDALNEYGQKNDEVEAMIDTNAINNSFDIDMSSLFTGISAAGGFIDYLYGNVPWYYLVIPVAVCFSALALLLGLVKNR